MFSSSTTVYSILILFFHSYLYVFRSTFIIISRSVINIVQEQSLNYLSIPFHYPVQIKVLLSHSVMSQSAVWKDGWWHQKKNYIIWTAFSFPVLFEPVFLSSHVPMFLVHTLPFGASGILESFLSIIISDISVVSILLYLVPTPVLSYFFLLLPFSVLAF